MALTRQLWQRRDAAVARHDAAARRWWPNKDAPGFRQELTAVVQELERVLEETAGTSAAALERSRTARWLADAYADLARDQRVATGEDLAHLARAAGAYQVAESLLPADADRDRAVLNFNYANALRRFDAEDVPLLESAKARYQAALQYFAAREPETAAQVRQALESVLVLLRLAPLAKAVASTQLEIERMGELLSDKAGAAEIQAQLRRVVEGGGPAVLARRTIDLLEELPESIRARDSDGKLRAMISNLVMLSAQGPEEGRLAQNAAVLGALQERLRRELDEGKLDGPREAAVRSAIERLGAALTSVGDDVETIRASLRDLRSGAEALLPAVRNASYGLPLPPEGSRAARAHRLFWGVRRATLVEMLSGGGGPRERDVRFRLAIRQNEADRELVAAGADDLRALQVERELLRPQVVEARRYMARSRPCLTTPFWPSEPGRVDPSAVLFSGAGPLRAALEPWCRSSGLELLAEADADDWADARWRQIAAAHVAVLDLTVPPGAPLANVTYELGIAQALGKPVVVAALAGAPLPFDLDVLTARLASPSEPAPLFEAIDAASFWLPGASAETSRLETGREAVRRYAGAEDVSVRQAAEDLERLDPGADPLEFEAALEGLLALAPRPRPAILRPPWATAYPVDGERRLFHVMPFRPSWAEEASRRASLVCERLGVRYVRGDQPLDARVIPSIWREIGQATHVLADLTDLNPNVALELGWAHLLGKDALLVGRGVAEQLVFPSIAKLRVAPLRERTYAAELEALVMRWLTDPTRERRSMPRRKEST